MNRLRAHFARHWHHHLALWFGIASALILVFGAAGASVAIYRHLHGGFKPGGPMPPMIRIEGGAPLPRQVSLTRYITRVHNQGLSNSCVAQTLSTIEEITQRMRRHTHYFSAGFIYDQINGGTDQGSTYNDAFRILLTQGDATLKSFPHDGQDYLALPGPAARANARKFRFRSWRSISVSDSHTIQYELAHHRPIALAIPVHDTVYNHFNTPLPVFSDYGTLHFWHSITVVGYNTTGIQILNSWGKAYGQNGITTFSWGYLNSSGGIMAISMPQPPTHHTHNKPATKHHKTHKKRRNTAKTGRKHAKKPAKHRPAPRRPNGAPQPIGSHPPVTPAP